MPRGQVSSGQCLYCGATVVKSQAGRHLAKCLQRLEKLAAVEHKRVPRETLFHLRVRDRWRPEFWLDLEMRGSAKLQDLDRYLRAIWLECCGHLSRFSLDGGGSDDFPLDSGIGEVFQPSLELTHIYDFGTSSETLIKVVRAREGKPLSRHPVELMIRNCAPEYSCGVCGRPATRLCMECLREKNTWEVVCDQHIKAHAHLGDFGDDTIPLVNSPRLGLCGYDGPANPPY